MIRVCTTEGDDLSLHESALGSELEAEGHGLGSTLPVVFGCEVGRRSQGDEFGYEGSPWFGSCPAALYRMPLPDAPVVALS